MVRIKVGVGARIKNVKYVILTLILILTFTLTLIGSEEKKSIGVSYEYS